MSLDFSLMVCVVAIGKPVAKKAKCQAESTPLLLQPAATVVGLALDAESQETQMTAADDDVEPSQEDLLANPKKHKTYLLNDAIDIYEQQSAGEKSTRLAAALAGDSVGIDYRTLER
jgi:hypothetical protein